MDAKLQAEAHEELERFAVEGILDNEGRGVYERGVLGPFTF